MKANSVSNANESRIEAFLDKLSPRRHKENCASYAALLSEARNIIQLRKGDSITDFLAAFRGLFVFYSRLYHLSLMTKEKYYAIRIGDPRRHFPYFMLRHDNSRTPALFNTRAEAATMLPKDADSATRIVCVWLSSTKGTKTK